MRRFSQQDILAALQAQLVYMTMRISHLGSNTELADIDTALDRVPAVRSTA